MNTQPRHKSREVIRPGYRHCNIPDGIFHDQVPADDPGDQLPEAGIGIGIGAAADGDPGSEPGITHGGEAAGHCRENKEKGNSRPPVGGGSSDGAEDPCPDNRRNTERCEIHNREALLQVV